MSAPRPDGKTITLAEAIARCLEAKKFSNYSECYLRSLRQYLNLFAAGREKKPLADIDETTIMEWFEGRDEAPYTRASNAGRLSALFQFAWRRRWVPENPCRRLEPIRLIQQSPQILTVRQAARALAWTRKEKPWQLGWLVLNLMAGLRPMESIKVGWEDINLDEGTVTVSAAASKVRRRRIVPLQPAAIAWLRLAKELGAELKPHQTTYRRWLRHLRIYLGFKDWPQDILRHSNASYLLAHSEDAFKVARWLGNSPKILLTAYAQLVTKKDAARFWRLIPKDKTALAPRSAAPANIVALDQRVA